MRPSEKAPAREVFRKRKDGRAGAFRVTTASYQQVASKLETTTTQAEKNNARRGGPQNGAFAGGAATFNRGRRTADAQTEASRRASTFGRRSERTPPAAQRRTVPHRRGTGPLGQAFLQR